MDTESLDDKFLREAGAAGGPSPLQGLEVNEVGRARDFIARIN